MATAVESKAPSAGIVDIQMLRPRTAMARFTRGVKEAFTPANLWNMAERCLWLAILWGVFTGYFVAFYYIAISIRDERGFIELPENRVHNYTVVTPNPWLIVAPTPRATP